MLELGGHQESVNDLVITPDDRWLVTGSDDDTLRVWDLQAKDPSVAGVVLAGHTGDVTALRVAAGGAKIVSAAMDNTLRVWDLTKKDRVVDEYALHGHSAAINGVEMAPDGLVAVSGSDDGTLRIWDVHVAPRRRRREDVARSRVARLGRSDRRRGRAIAPDRR